MAIREKEFGIWQSTTWKSYFENVRDFALGLHQLCFKRGNNLAYAGDKRPQGLYAELAVQALGGAVVGIYPDSHLEQVEYIINHSDSIFLVAGDQEQADKVLELKSTCPKVKKVIVDDPKGMRHYDDPLLAFFKDIQASGRRLAETQPQLFDEARMGLERIRRHTQDLDASRILLEETTVRMAGPRTAFGDAIGLGITLFEQSEVEERVIIALTDGNDTGSRVPPAEAAKIANDNGITIHVIGVGDPEAVGEEKLDEAALRGVASTTGGRYFHAADRDQLQEIYTELDRIDTREVETATYRPRIDLFHWPLAAFLALGLLYHVGLLLRRASNRQQATHG